MPFLSPKEVGDNNARSELNLMNFFGNIKDIDLSRSDLANFYEVSGQGYHFFHFGYAYRALWAGSIAGLSRPGNAESGYADRKRGS